MSVLDNILRGSYSLESVMPKAWFVATFGEGTIALVAHGEWWRPKRDGAGPTLVWVDGQSTFSYPATDIGPAGTVAIEFNGVGAFAQAGVAPVFVQAVLNVNKRSGIMFSYDLVYSNPMDPGGVLVLFW